MPCARRKAAGLQEPQGSRGRFRALRGGGKGAAEPPRGTGPGLDHQEAWEGYRGSEDTNLPPAPPQAINQISSSCKTDPLTLRNRRRCGVRCIHSRVAHRTSGRCSAPCSGGRGRPGISRLGPHALPWTPAAIPRVIAARSTGAPGAQAVIVPARSHRQRDTFGAPDDTPWPECTSFPLEELGDDRRVPCCPDATPRKPRLAGLQDQGT